MDRDRFEILLWSIVLPCAGQFINQKYSKGIILIALVLIVNVQSNFNEAIFLSFQGNIEAAIEITDYNWLMFYPCLYFFSMYDAFKDARGKELSYSFFPFVFAAYFVTIGVVLSSNFRLWGVPLGPVFLPTLFLIPGLLVGFIIMRFKSKATWSLKKQRRGQSPYRSFLVIQGTRKLLL